MSTFEEFEKQKDERISSYNSNTKGLEIGRQFTMESCYNGYTYNFSWMGLPIIQFPQDIVIMQEIIFKIKPDCIIETGVARGGSLVFYASLLELLGNGKVIGVDIDIRDHNRKVIEEHQMSKRIKLIQGSSTSEEVILKIKDEIKDAKNILVCLDSKHTHDHVLEELNAYKNFVSPDSYLIVFDTTIETFDEDVANDLESKYHFKPWGKGSNPHTAIMEFLSSNSNFKIEDKWHKKAMITNFWDGVLKKNSQ